MPSKSWSHRIYGDVMSNKKMKKLLFPIILIFITSCQQEMTFEELGRNCEKAMSERKWETSITILDKMIKIKPDNGYLYFSRALAKSNLKSRIDVNDMLNDVEKSIKIDDNNPYSWFLRFTGNFIKKDYHEATKDLDKIIKLKGEIPFFLTWKANCAFANKDFKTAKQYYEKRLSSTGEYEEIKNCYYYLIFSKYYDGDEDGAFMDAAFLKKRGFEKDMELINLLSEDKLKNKGMWEELANFYIPQMTMEELTKIIENKK